MPKTIALVACVSQKNSQPMQAKDLYCSDWFLKASAYAARHAEAWYILSAKYGLLAPNTVIPSYNETLKTMPKHLRLQWAQKVLADLKPLLSSSERVIFLAGTTYREHLVGPLQRMGCIVEIPMEGLKIGEQLSWLKTHLK